jgi:hypothetical protein
MKRCAVVKCVKKFKDRVKYPFLKFPKVGTEYMVRDIFVDDKGNISFTLFEIRNENVRTADGSIVEPSFSAANFELVRMPMNADEVILKALTSKD